MNTYTEKEILSSEDFADDFSTYGAIKYELTDSEKGWLQFITGRYSIADYIHNNTDTKTGLTTFDPIDFSVELNADCEGSGKAVCLSDETALQKIFFYGYQE